MFNPQILGRGAYGEVREGQLGDGMQVAVKTLHGYLAEINEFIAEEFDREVSVSRKVVDMKSLFMLFINPSLFKVAFMRTVRHARIVQVRPARQRVMLTR